MKSMVIVDDAASKSQVSIAYWVTWHGLHAEATFRTYLEAQRHGRWTLGLTEEATADAIDLHMESIK